MAAEVSADLTVIHDEDVLRHMWQQTDDFGRKKEIRQRMYKLREQRLKDFYTDGDENTIGSVSVSVMAGRKHAAPGHADSLDQESVDFVAHKTKEIRDSESPTRDIHRRGDNKYWNTVQQSSYSDTGDDGDLRHSYERSSTGTGRSEDGRTQAKMEADERGFSSSKTAETEGGKTMSNMQQHDAHIATAEKTKTDNGESQTFSTSSEHQEKSSSVTESKTGSSSHTSSKWQSSSSSSSSRKVISSSAITSAADTKMIMADDMDCTDNSRSIREDVDTSTIRRTKNLNQDSHRYQVREVNDSTNNQVDSNSFIEQELRNNIKNTMNDASIDIRDKTFTDSNRESKSTYTTKMSSNVNDYTTDNKVSTSKRVTQDTKADSERGFVAVDQNIMTEINKLDSYLSTQNTGTNTPASPLSVVGDANWTVVSNTDGEFVYRDDKSISSPGSRVAPIKHPDNLDLPKENTEGQYVTTYNEHYTNKRISVDVSPTHDKFARSLRQSPPGTPRSSSRQSLDRSSPERKMKSSPRASPVKDRRTSVGSYTVERPSNLRRKSSDASRQTGSSPDSSLKGKRKFSTTQAKAAAKHRSSTPGTSPSTSPVRKQKEPSDSSSASDSDASQITYDKKSLNSSHTRVDVVRKNLMNSYEKESPTKDTESIDTVTRSPSRPSSPEKSSSRKNSYSLENKNTGILRKDTRSDSRSTITSVTEYKVPSGIAPQIREKSPEYSSEGSVSKEIKQSQSQRSPDSSPERAVFSPIKQFRTSPEITSNTIQLTSTETNQKEVSHRNTDFIKHESADSASNIEATKNQVNKRTSSPSKEGTTKTPTNQSKREHMSSPTNTESQKNEGSSLGKRTQSPDKDTKGRRPSLPHRSQSPQKDQQRSVSPTKSLSKARKPSVPSSRSPSPTKSRSPSPPKKDTSRTTSNVRKSSLKKESSYNAPPPTRRSSRQGTPSPVKDIVNMYPSISKSPTTRSSSPEKTKSPSPQRISTKRTRQEISSPSVSPCSSPERNSKPARKTSSPKATANTRSTRRSSIPRADQSTVRKTVETKIEIRAKPVTKIPSTMSRVNTSKQNIDHKNVRTDSQGSLGRQTVTRTNSSTLNKTVPKSKEPAKKSPAPTRTVTTTAVISLSRPTVTSQTRHSSTHTTSRTTASVVKRSSSKEITTKKDDVTGNKKSSTTTSTNRVASKTSTTNEKPTNRETDRSSFSPSPERSIANEGQCESFIVNEKDSVHGFKGETIHIEISENENNLENETRPELYPDTEDDEITDNQNTTNQNTSHLTEKHINVDSKPKSTSQFVVTIKKPTGTSTPKAATKPVTMRSSSGPVRGTTQATSKTQTTKTITNNRQTATVQKAESLNLIRTNDRNAPKNSVPRRQTSKPEILNVKSQQSPGQNTETGIASRNVTTAKSATIKRNVQQQKKTIQKQTKTDSIYSSHSEDEDENIPSVVTPNQQEQQYIEELDEMRRNEELEYASKLTATKNQDNQLLSVIIQHPKSSRESSPDYSNRSHPYAVSDDGSSNPRYADLISEPEDLEILDSKTTDGPKLNRLAHNDSRFEQVTDLDEEPDVSDFTLDVSVADRVSHFLETSRTHINSTPSREDLEPINSTDSPKTVLKAKAMFETISKNHQAPPAPGNKPVDILSRPSVFEGRRGQIEPKPVSSDTLSETESPEPEVLRRGSIRVEYQEKQAERAEAKQYNEARISIKESTTLRTQTQSPTKDVLASKTTTEKREDRTSDRSATQVKVAPNNQSITNPTHSKRDTNSMPDKTQKNAPKAKPFERMISATAEISSKRAFFENKSQSHTPKNNLKSDSPAKERKPLTDSIQNKENIRGQSPTRKTSRSSPERKMSTPSPVKERKTSLKSESPERRISLTKSVKERRSSFTKEDITVGQTSVIQKKDSFSKEPIGRKVSPSRAPITQKNFPDHSPSSTVLKTSPAQSTPRSPVKDRKPSFPGEPAESPTRRKSSRSSPVRLTKSPERSSPSPTNENEPVELNKARKFGVTLRRTSSTTSAGTPRRTSIPGETQEVEDVTDVALLEIMMEKAVGYEQRRRIRSQIREVKKKEEESRATAKGTGRRTSPTRDYKPSTKVATPTAAETERPERRRASSPTKKSPERQTTTEPQSQRRQSQPAADQRTKRPASPTKSAGTRPQAQSLTDAPGGRRSPALRPTTTTSPSARSTAADTETTTAQVTTTSTVRTQKRTETLVESAGVDCITSSYGVGPTDETGRPLFGLRALRRSNTNKQLTDAITDEPEVRAAEPAVSEPVCDGRGRPLFGGLKALRAIDTSSDDMPEQKTSAQLRQLVQHHEKVVKETNGPQDQPRQKPKARLRDNYVTQEEEQMTGSHLTEVTNLNRGLSLRSIIQKHENISNSPGDVRSEMESSHTVVSSRTAVSSNGSVSVKEDFIRGDISSKNGGEPVGKVTRTQFTYQSPEGDDKGVNKITTSTATIGGRRTSGPRITEIEDVQDSPSRKSSLKSSSKTSTVTERTFSRKGSSPSEYEDSRKTERLTSEDRITSSGVTSTDDSKRKISSRQTESRGNAASPTLRRQKSTEEEPVVEEKRKTVVRGDSVRALQHKFQQATENAANSVARSQASRTGLILRTSSFKTPSASAQSQNTVSSTLKQSTILSADKKNGRQSPDKGRQESPVNDTTTAHREATDITSRGDSVTKRTGETSSTSSRVTETTTTSFLDNTSRVTGVQDILTRMRNADLVGESGDTDADREARALLNKFLGASVILQGMEQGMRAPLPEGTPDSAALVRSVEKQRKATTKQKEEDIENIWDEQVLKTLLEQCTDYEGRRTLRARLRTVMAQHKACSDLVAATGAGSNSSEHAESESKQVTTRTDGGTVTRTEVHTKTSTNRLTKANSVAASPFAKFRQLERQNSAPSVGQATPLYKITDPRVARSASTIKDRLLSWVQAQTREYKNIQIENFSTSWNNGLAFCALIHHFCPEAFDYDKLTPEQRRHNFELAFRVAEEEADIAPLLDVEDMVVMRRPDWKCVFTYVQSVYRRFHSTPEAVRC